MSRINQKGKVGTFKPLTQKDAIVLSKLFSETVSTFTYTFCPDVLKIKNTGSQLRIIFKSDAQVQQHIFTKDLGVETGPRPVPGLIWNYNTNGTTGNLDLYAYIDFKGEDTDLYNAPFMNCTGSSVCLGTSKIEIDPQTGININKAIESIQQGFWKSAFTHSGGQQIKGTYQKLAKAILNKATFPYEVLQPILHTKDIPLKLKNIL